MLGKNENKHAQNILKEGSPSYRKAYSDRTAWLMAYMAELADLKFDKPIEKSPLVERVIMRSASRGIFARGTAGKIIGAIRKSYDYDYEAEKQKLEDSLKQIGWVLLDTISENATQAYVAYQANDEDKDEDKEKFAVLAFRGTEADRMADIRADAKAAQTTCPTGGRVHSGFKEHYDDAERRVEELLDDEKIKDKPLFITGHSLGGAVATMATRRLSDEHKIAACYTYGAPRVGTEEWVTQIKSPIYRIVNSADPVPMVPLSGIVIFLFVKVLRTAGSLIPVPVIRPALVWSGNWLERNLSGYTHAGNMRFLTDCEDGDLSKVNLLYSVSWGRRFRGLLTRVTPFGRVLKDHGIAVYRRKLMRVAERRNALRTDFI